MFGVLIAEAQHNAIIHHTMLSQVLWRLTPKEVPNEAALAQLGLANNTKVWPIHHSLCN